MARDPYCGWNHLLQQCTTAPNGNPHAVDWEQELSRCPDLALIPGREYNIIQE